MSRIPIARAAGFIVTIVAAAISVAAALWTKSGAGIERTRPVEDEPIRGDRIALRRRADFTLSPTVDQKSPFPGEISRRVLAVYDSNETWEETDDYDKIYNRPMDPEVATAHRMAELPLNHLGLAVDFVDVNIGELPADEKMENYLGVLVWLEDGKMAQPDRFLGWLIDQVSAKRRVVVIGNLGAFTNLEGQPADPKLVKSAMKAIGGEYLGNWTDDGSLIALELADERMVGFERPLPARFEFYQQYRSLEGNTVYLQLERTDVPESVSDVIWTGPGGGFVMPSMAYREDRLGERYVNRWIINPFRFFAAAFGVEEWPRFDFTTLNGSRIFYAHIDGDGLGMISELDYKSLCGAVVRDRIFLQYELPWTASIVVGRTQPPPEGQGSEKEVHTAQSILALPNIEVGSHGRAHPMDWRAGEVPNYSHEDLGVSGLPGYVLSGDGEIAASVKYINEELAPPGKPCKIMLWTGWCNPNQKHIAVAYRLGIRNLNGGDPRMDDHYPSFAHMVSPVHRVGPYPQFLTSAANDYILTEEWTPPYYRYRNVIQTFERSGNPRRVVPINIYLHFYISRNLAALTGLESVIDWILKREVAPIFASEYVDIAKAFHWARLAREKNDRWHVRKAPALRTVRFDRPVHVDLEQSKNVLGYLWEKKLKATYVHLGAAEEATIQLSNEPPKQPYLVSGTHWVDFLDASPEKIKFTTYGAGIRTFRFGGMPKKARYSVTSMVRGKPEREENGLVDKAGLLTITVTDSLPNDVAVTVARVKD